jgi:putative MATE family efflux protein
MELNQEVSIIKKIIQLSLPVMMGEIMFSLMSFIDRFFIAKLGIEQSAGASLSSTVIWVLMTVSALITGGCVALVARRTGENNTGERARSAEQSLFLALFFGVIIAVTGYLLSPHIMAFYNAEARVEQLGTDYLSILILGYPMVMIAHTAASVFQAGGDTRTPMKIFITMSVLNIILDPIMIFGIEGFIPAMGVKGAALATLISEFIACSAIVIIIFRHKEYGLSILRSLIPDIVMIKKILAIGGWSGMNSLSRPLSAIFLQKIITYHGTAAVAGFSFGVQWISIVFIFMQGMRVSISTLVGQFLGSKSFKDAEDTTKAGLQAGYVFVAIVSVFGIVFSEQAISVFTTDPEVVAAGSGYLIIVYLGMFFHVPMTVYAAGFNGAGHTAPPMIAAFIANWIGKIGFAYVTTYIFGLGINWVWAGISLSIVMEGLGLSMWFKRGSWKDKKI